MSQKILGLPLALLVLLPGAATAHHSYAMFDMTRTVELKGVVDTFKWTNPHAWIVLTVKDKSGTPVEWNVEMNSPNNLVGLGWKRSSLKPGDAVTITIHPLKDNKTGGSFMSVALANGTALKG